MLYPALYTADHASLSWSKPLALHPGQCSPFLEHALLFTPPTAQWCHEQPYLRRPVEHDGNRSFFSPWSSLSRLLLAIGVAVLAQVSGSRSPRRPTLSSSPWEDGTTRPRVSQRQQVGAWMLISTWRLSDRQRQSVWSDWAQKGAGRSGRGFFLSLGGSKEAELGSLKQSPPWSSFPFYFAGSPKKKKSLRFSYLGATPNFCF